MDVEAVVAYAALAALPAAAFWAAARALDRFSTVHRPRTRTAPQADAERLVRHLTRLEREYRSVEAADVPARGTRLRTLALAYDDVLLACCDALQVPRPAGAPLEPSARLQVEAALAARGLVW